MGNGLKTWLNVFVLSISFVLIVFMQALLEGWSKQAVTDAVAWEIGGGQYWSSKYDPYDPFSLDSCARNTSDRTGTNHPGEYLPRWTNDDSIDKRYKTGSKHACAAHSSP